MTSTTRPRPSARPAFPARRRRLGDLARHPVVAASAVALVIAGAGAAAGTDAFRVFRAQQLETVEVRADDLVALPDLNGLGEGELAGDPRPREADDARAAGTETGLAVPTATVLPDGVTGTPAYQVAGPVGATVTLDAARAAEAGLPDLPAELDGAEFQVDAGPGVAQIWTSDTGLPRLVVGTARAPQLSADEADVAAMRDYLLSLPGMPDGLVASLDGLDASAGTLPLPVPVPEGLADSTTSDVGGVTATVLETPDRALAAVVWIEGGVVTLVAGSYSGDELLDIARGLE
jgi:hypothetical protein